MSTYRVATMANRVVLIHDMPDRVVVSELDLEQADLLLEQLQMAVSAQLMALRDGAGMAALA